MPGALLWGPFCLSLSLAGPLRSAHIPILGPALVRVTLMKYLCGRGLDSDSDEEESSEEEMPPSKDTKESMPDVVVQDGAVSV